MITTIRHAMKPISGIYFYLPFLGLAAFIAASLCRVESGSKTIEASTTQGKTSDLLRIVLSGWMEGHMEPCGCASAHSGGLDRRSYWLKRNKHLYDFSLEGGNLIAGNNPYEKHKLYTILMVLSEYARYPVVALGPDDLSIGIRDLVDYNDVFDSLFVVSDLRVKRKGKLEAPLPTFKIVKAGKYRVLVLNLASAISDQAKHKELANLHIIDAGKAVTEAQKAAGQRGKDYDLCLLNVYQGEKVSARKLAVELPGIDLLVAYERDYHLRGLPKVEVFEHKTAAMLVKRTQVVFPGARGRTLLLWTGKPDGEGSWQQARPLTRAELPAHRNEPRNSRGVPIMTDPEVFDLLREFKRRLPEEKILEKMAERRPTKNGAVYVGNEACADCHGAAMEVLEKSKHFDAWKVLLEREKKEEIPYTQNPDCVSCHSMGYGEKGGFVNAKKSKDLVSVGCESCHGPGSKHVDAMENLPPDTELADIEAALKKGALIKANSAGCYVCHNSEQSPGFQFVERWKEIKH